MNLKISSLSDLKPSTWFRIMLLGWLLLALSSPIIARAEDIFCEPEPAKVTVKTPNKGSKPVHSKNFQNQASRKKIATPFLGKAAPIYPAKILAAYGDVRLQARANASTTPSITRDMLLYMGDVIQTGARGFVSLRFGDGSINVLPPNATIRLSSASKDVPRVELIKGEVESRIVKTPNAKKNTFEIQLPTVSIGVRGTHFKVSLDDIIGRVWVEDGVVKVLHRTQCLPAQEVQAMQGVRIGVSETKVIPLLDAPDLLKSEEAQLDKNKLFFLLQPVAGAVRYRAQVAADANFTDIRQEAYSTSTQIVIPNDALSDGFYFVRVSAFDELNIEGHAEAHVFLRNRRAANTGFTFQNN